MENNAYAKGFRPYAAAALLVGLAGGFTALLGPAFVKDLGLAYNNTTWTALAAAISTAACAPVMGKLADAIGRRRTLLMGVALYALGSGLCAAAGTLPAMLFARFVVGTGVSAIAPVVMAYILTEFPLHRIAAGFSLYMLISSGSVVIGPTVGAWIIDAFGWRWMMVMCAGMAVVTWLYCASAPEENVVRKNALEGFDIAGALWILLFFGLLLCVPAFGQNIGWSSPVFLLSIPASLLAMAALVRTERRARNPILPAEFLKRKSFLLSVLALALTQGLMQANMTNTMVFVEYTQPGNTVISGYAISVMYIGMALGAALLGPLADRFEPRAVLTGSLGATAAGVGSMLLFTPAASPALLMLSLGTLGFGLGANGTIFMKVVLSDLPQETAAAQTGTYGLFRDLAAPFGVAVLVPLFTNGVTRGLAGNLAPAEAAVQSIHTLAWVELVCVCLGILVVRFLPRIHRGKTK